MKDYEIKDKTDEYASKWLEGEIDFNSTVILLFSLTLRVLTEILNEVRKIYLKLI